MLEVEIDPRLLRYSLQGVATALLLLSLWQLRLQALSPLLAWGAQGTCVLVLLYLWWPTAAQRRRYRLRLQAGGLLLSWRAPGGDWSAAQPVSVCAGSILWPGLLWLRLRSEDRTMHEVPVSLFALPEADFKALSRLLRAQLGRTQ